MRETRLRGGWAAWYMRKRGLGVTARKRENKMRCALCGCVSCTIIQDAVVDRSDRLVAVGMRAAVDLQFHFATDNRQ